jgi:glucosamine--fructose-6-phosphate aminotransferase (isomerizing)
VAAGLQVIEGPYLQDLLLQPEALRDTARALAASGVESQRGNPIPVGRNRFLLTGMGSSLFALYPLCTRLNRSGHPAALVEAGELLRYHPDTLRHSIMIVVSQSGRSAEIVRLSKRQRADCFLIGVTNSDDSPLAKRADAVVYTAAGEEATVSCKTYVATLAALAWLAGVLEGEGSSRLAAALGKAAAGMEAYLAGWRHHVERLASRLEGVEHLFLAGRGDSLAAALTGGLIIKEAAHFHAEGMSAPQFRHGPFEMLSRRVLVLVFAGGAETRKLNFRLVEDIRAAGGRAEVIGESATEAVFRLPRVSDVVRPFFEILPVEMITLALAAMAGREAGRFERATKITAVE